MNKHLTTVEILAGLTELGPAPTDKGLVEMIVCRPSIEERTIVEKAELRLEDGLAGDNWLARGSKSTEDGSANPKAQITLMNSRVIQVLAQDRSRWPLAGDQLFVDFDLSIDNLPAGTRIAIGTAILEVSDLPHTGCAKFTERFGHDAIRFINSPEGRRQNLRGINTRIVQPGWVCVGDMITKVEIAAKA